MRFSWTRRGASFSVGARRASAFFQMKRPLIPLISFYTWYNSCLRHELLGCHVSSLWSTSALFCRSIHTISPSGMFIFKLTLLCFCCVRRNSILISFSAVLFVFDLVWILARNFLGLVAPVILTKQYYSFKISHIVRFEWQTKKETWLYYMSYIHVCF